jgi:type II secretory pathway component PulM
MLQPRERRVLFLGALALFALFGYFLLWEPLTARHTVLREQVVAQAELYRWMQAAAAEAKSLRSPAGEVKSAGNGGISLPALLDQSLRQSALATVDKRLEPKGEDNVRMEFAQVGFDDLLAWLIGLRAQHRVEVTAATLERLAQPGQVKAWLTLER